MASADYKADHVGSKQTQAILTAIKDAKHNITLELTAFMLTQELGKHLSQITTWTEALARCLLAKHRDWKCVPVQFLMYTDLDPKIGMPRETLLSWARIWSITPSA